MKIDRKKRAFYRNINILQRALLVVILGLIIQILVSEIFILLIEDIGIRRPLDDAGGLELDERFVALGQQNLPVVCWVDTDDLAEAAVEMVVVVETDFLADGLDGSIPGQQQLGILNPLGNDIFVQRRTGIFLEDPAQMVRAEIGHLGQLFQRQILCTCPR